MTTDKYEEKELYEVNPKAFDINHIDEDEINAYNEWQQTVWVDMHEIEGQ